MASKEPCKSHKMAYLNPNMPEVENYISTKCKRCGWWIKKGVVSPKEQINSIVVNKKERTKDIIIAVAFILIVISLLGIGISLIF